MAFALEHASRHGSPSLPRSTSDNMARSELSTSTGRSSREREPQVMERQQDGPRNVETIDLHTCLFWDELVLD